MKHFLLSKTFWLSLVAFVIEIGNAFQSFPLSPTQAHVISAILILAVAVNRALKNLPQGEVVEG